MIPLGTGPVPEHMPRKEFTMNASSFLIVLFTVLFLTGCGGNIAAPNTPGAAVPTISAPTLAVPTAVPPSPTKPTVTAQASPTMSGGTQTDELAVQLVSRIKGSSVPMEGPWNIAFDADGNLFIGEGKNNRVLKLSPDGKLLNAWGSKGEGDGQLFFADGFGSVVVDRQGNVYVADTVNYRIQKFDQDGKYLLKWGKQGAGDGEFDAPTAVAVNAAGEVYVTDGRTVSLGATIKYNNRIQKFDADGKFLGKWGEEGSKDGQFNGALDLEFDAKGNLFVADNGNGRIQKFDADGKFVAKWNMCGGGSTPFMSPIGIGVDSKGNVYVADIGTSRICVFDNNGKFLGSWGSPGTGDLQFDTVADVSVDGKGNIYTIDHSTSEIKIFRTIKPLSQ
jgi:DNA-binding beta-propeller fold protein YncE